MTNIRLIDIDTDTSEKVIWHYKFVTVIILTRIPHQNIKIFRISKKAVQERTLPPAKLKFGA